MPKLFVASGIAHPESGGPATYLYELLPALQAQPSAWDVRLQAYSDDAPTETYPYPVTRIPRRRLPIRMAHYALRALPNLQWADVVYTHTIDLPLYAPKRAPRIIKIVGDQAWERCVRKGWIAPDVNIDTFQDNDYGTLVYRQKQSRAQQVRAHDAVIVPSEYLGRMVARWGVPEERIHIIYNAMPPVPEHIPPPELLRQRYQLPEGVPLLLTAARLAPWKGIDHTLKALQTLPDVHLLVAGDGDDEGRLRLLAEPVAERVHFLGRVPRADLYGLMGMAHYFVLYSGYEGLSHVLLESLRAGTPIIASDKGGNPEVVRDGVNGLLVPYSEAGSADVLRDVLAHALTGDSRARLANGTSDGLERFQFDTMVAQTDAVLRGVV
jgi:glycosyltransferase involved in cell wall biosynthesis